MNISNFSFEKYKCFKSRVFLDKPSLFNLLIGKNNAGKTSVLEILTDLFSNDKSTDELYKSPEISYDIILTKELINEIFFYESDELKKYLTGKTARITIYRKSFISGIQRHPTCELLYADNFYISYDGTKHHVNLTTFAEKVDERFDKGHVDYISSERDVSEENDSNACDIFNDGRGVTNWLNAKLNHAKYREEKVKPLILDYLNKLFVGESAFDDLRLLQNENGKWEIYLTENNKEIPISEMGSGMKTVLFVFVLLVRHTLDREKVTFLFEELENNLHPIIFRRLLKMIYTYSVENKVTVYITSHSTYAIDFFYNLPETSLYHISKTKEGSKIQAIDNSQDKINILNDLGVKPSDILLSNGLIWVEGPSDRIYINNWINLLDSSLIENNDYSFMFYGGRLLSHYSLEGDDGLLAILKTNINSAIVIDSDKKCEESVINGTKKRIKQSFCDAGLFCWITKGKEIENYLSKKDINKMSTFEIIDGKRVKRADSNNLAQVNQYEDFSSYIAAIYPNFEQSKVTFAKDIKMDYDSLDVLDLKEKMEELINTIKKWNR